MARRVTLPDALQPWDRRPGETSRAHAAFVAYRDLGATRSVRKLAREPGSNLTQLFEWSKRHDWVDRAGAYDQWMDRQRQLEQVDAIREMHRRHAAVATQMMGKAVERIRNIDATLLTVREAVLLIDLAARIERQARGEPSTLIAHTGELDVRELPGASILTALKRSPELTEFADRLDELLAEPPPQVPV